MPTVGTGLHDDGELVGREAEVAVDEFDVAVVGRAWPEFRRTLSQISDFQMAADIQPGGGKRERDAHGPCGVASLREARQDTKQPSFEACARRVRLVTGEAPAGS